MNSSTALYSQSSRRWRSIPGHPFPYLANRSLCLVVCLRTNSASPLPHTHLAPVDLREQMLSSIRREAEHARGGKTSRIVAKVNSLIDPANIQELYLASQAGGQIDLIVRGMCSLRPGLADFSECIQIISIALIVISNMHAYFTFKTAASPSTFWPRPI